MEFEEIYRVYFNDVFRYIRRLSGNAHIAEEITADTFFKAMRSIGRFRGDCDIRVWLCRIARNSYLSYRKRSGRFYSAEDAELLSVADPGETVEEALVQHTEAALAQEIIHDLPELYKEVFMWRVFAELSFKQIGQMFGKSENWACVTYHRARVKIKEKLEAANHEKRV